MKRILACLATLAILASTSAARAQSPDPIADLIAGADAANVQGAGPDAAGDLKLRATLYHGGRGIRGRDSLGCPVSPMRTVAMDGATVARHSIIFIRETVGLALPEGGVHDGYWYVSDIGGAIRGSRIDLFTGPGSASMRPLMGLNLKTLTVSKVGQFSGCPPIDGGIGTRIADAAN